MSRSCRMVVEVCCVALDPAWSREALANIVSFVLDQVKGISVLIQRRMSMIIWNYTIPTVI